MANNSNIHDDDNYMDDKRIGPMEVGYIFATIPFILFCIVLGILVVASYF